MALPPGLISALYATSLFLVGAVTLYFTTLRRSFDLRRAKIFIRLRFYEGFLIGAGATIIALVTADALIAWTNPASLRLFPDATVRAMLYAPVGLLYLQFYTTIARGGRSRHG